MEQVPHPAGTRAVGYTSPSTHHIAFISILRGPAALIVVWSHLGGLWSLIGGTTSPLQTAWVHTVVGPLRLMDFGGRLGVYVFFLISGYIITHASLKEDRAAFAVKRILRIFPLLWLTIGVMAAINLFDPSGMFHGFDTVPWQRWLQSLVLADSFTGAPILLVSWTLVVEVMFYALVFAVLGHQRERPLLSSWLLAGGAFLLAAVVHSLPLVPASNAREGVFSLCFLVAGRMIYQIHTGQVRVAPAVTVAASCAVAMYLVCRPWQLLSFGSAPHYAPLTSIFLAFALFLGLMLAAPRRIPRPLATCADMSYSLYMLHLPIGFYVLALAWMYHVNTTLAVLVAIVLTLGCARVSAVLVERPSQQLARRLTGQIARSRAGRRLSPAVPSWDQFGRRLSPAVPSWDQFESRPGVSPVLATTAS